MTGPVYLLQSEADIPAGDGWMSASEAQQWAAFPVEKRRRDWRLGRWTAKRLLAALDGLGAEDAALRRYAVIPLPSGVPTAHRDGHPLSRPLSLSHSHGVALALTSRDEDPGASIGCDLERVEPRVPGFEEDYLTDDERRHAQGSPGRDLATTLLWTGKESVMKAVGEGLRLPAKAVEVGPREAWPLDPGPLVPFLVLRPSGILQGHWGILRGLAAALVVPLGSGDPTAIEVLET